MGKVLIIKGADFSDVAVDVVDTKMYIGLNEDIDAFFARFTTQIPATDSASLASAYGTLLNATPYVADGVVFYTQGSGIAKVYLADMNNNTATLVGQKNISSSTMYNLDIAFDSPVSVGVNQFLAIKVDNATSGANILPYWVNASTERGSHKSFGCDNLPEVSIKSKSGAVAFVPYTK